MVHKVHPDMLKELQPQRTDTASNFEERECDRQDGHTCDKENTSGTLITFIKTRINSYATAV